MRNPRRLLLLLLGVFVGLPFSQAVYCITPIPVATKDDALRSRLHIIIDPGHTPKQGGATGIRGIPEVQYNDEFACLLAAALEAVGHNVSLTRQPTQDISLDQRAAFANASGGDIFLAIHHDSAQVQYLEKFEQNALPAWRTTKPIQGYSVFVSQINPRFADSLGYAKSIAEALRSTGREPALHHAENIPGENRELLDARLGIYRFDELLVLRKTLIPALLLEVGVIVDAGDESHVTNPIHRKAMISAIVKALP